MEKTLDQNLGVIILLIKKNAVLMGKRKNAYAAGLYGSPGGRLELFETLENCAQRELKEETGVDANKFDFIGFIKDAQRTNGLDFIHFVFVCHEWVGEPSCKELDKCEGWEWFDVARLPVETLPALRSAVELYKSSMDRKSKKWYEEINS